MYSSILQDIDKSSCADARFKISPAYNGLYFAAPIKSAQDIGIWFLKDEPVILSAHHCPITAISFCDLNHGALLCSCSDDSVVLWDLSQYIGNEEYFHGIVLYSGISGISLCCFDHWEYRIALCCDRNILILDVKKKEILRQFTHTATITGCEFFCKDIMVSISDDGVCKVWNIGTGLSPCYRVVGGDLSVFTASHDMLAVVTTAGKIENFQLDSEHKLQHMSLFKVWKLVRDGKKIQATDSHSSKIDDAKAGDEGYYEESIQVLALKFLKFSAAADNKREFHFLPASSVCVPVYLFVVTTTGFLLLNTQNEIVNYYTYKDNSEELPSIMISATIFVTDTQVSLILIPISENVLYNCKINIGQITSVLEHRGLMKTANSLSFLSIGDLPAGSLLLKKVHAREHNKQGKYPAKPSKMAQPLTFQSRIRSSGYNLPPRNKMFCPVINRRKENACSIDNKKSNTLPLKKNLLEGTHCSYWEKQPLLKNKVQLSPHSNITAQHITDGNKMAAFGFVDGLIAVASLPHFSTVASLLYHNGTIRNLHFSHSDSSKLLLSGGSDKKLFIWDWRDHRQKPLLVIDSVNRFHESDKKRTPISEDITAAQFYYLDKFILFSFGNILNMALYHLDTACSDIKRYKTNSFHNNILSVQLECKRINAVAAINQFHSYLALCATSSSAICILDMNTGKVICNIAEVHSRPVYQIVLNEGSSMVMQPPEMHDVFGTAALTDGLKLWDLRTSRCIMYWKEHPNSWYPCSADISACGRYVVAGGEDRSVYIYDIRMARIAHKLTGHSDAVSNTNFLPTMSKILATARDCNAYIYGSDSL